MRVNFNSCWISTHNTSILCRLCGFGRSTWNIYKYLSHKFNRWICSIRSPKSIQIFSYSLSPRFTYAIPHRYFGLNLWTAFFLPLPSDQRFAAVNSILEYSCVINNKSVLIKLNYSECLKKNPTACSQIQTAVRLHSKGPAITVPVRHIKLL